MSPREVPAAGLPDSALTWIFGYGSLIWRPGFDYLRRRSARLDGWHRAFCRYSLRHRGTPQQPGLVVGLQPGKHCVGMAFGVEPGREGEALDYLDQREGGGYLRHRVSVTLLGLPEGAVSAWTYIPDPDHPSYFGEEEHEKLVRLVATGQGESGTALDYLRELISQLQAMEVEEPEMAKILAEAERYRGQNGGGKEPGGSGHPPLAGR